MERERAEKAAQDAYYNAGIGTSAAESRIEAQVSFHMADDCEESGHLRWYRMPSASARLSELVFLCIRVSLLPFPLMCSDRSVQTFRTRIHGGDKGYRGKDD